MCYFIIYKRSKDISDVLETDVWQTRDGVVVVSHDDNVKRMLCLKEDLFITETDYDTLKKAHTKSLNRRGDGANDDRSIISLRELLETYPDKMFYIDCKFRNEFFVRRVIQTIKEAGIAERVAVGSFHRTNENEMVKSVIIRGIPIIYKSLKHIFSFYNLR